MDNEVQVGYSLQTGPGGRVASKANVPKILERMQLRGLSDEAVEMVESALTAGVTGANFVRDATKIMLQNRTVSLGGRRKVRVNGVMNHMDRERLVDTWKTVFDIEFKSTSIVSCHDLPRANRDLELIRLAQLAYTEERLPVKLIGEKMQALKASAFAALNVVKVASPNLDVRGVATRNIARDPTTMKALRKRGVIISAETELYGSEFLSDMPGQIDDTKADILIARQVYFENGPVDIAEAMNAAGASKVFGSIIFSEGIVADPRINIGKVHRNPMLGSIYRVSKDARFKSGYMIGFGMNDLSNGYFHDLQSYLSMGVNCRVDTPHGSFSYTVTERYGDIIIYMMTRIPVELGSVVVRDRYEFNTGPKYKRIGSWKYKTGCDPRLKSSFERVTIDVPADDWDRLGSKLMDSMDGDAGKIQAATRYLIQIQKSFTLFGKSIRQGSKTDVFELFPLAAAAVIKANYLREVHSRVIAKTRGEIDAQRAISTQSLLSLPITAVWGMVVRGARRTAELTRSIGSSLGISDILSSWFDLWFVTPDLEPSVEDIDVLRSIDAAAAGSLGSFS